MRLALTWTVVFLSACTIPPLERGEAIGSSTLVLGPDATATWTFRTPDEQIP